MFGLFDKEKKEKVHADPKKIEAAANVEKKPAVQEIDVELKVQVLQKLIIEQRAMIRHLHKICTMLSENHRYEPVKVELDKLQNQLDKLK